MADIQASIYAYLNTKQNLPLFRYSANVNRYVCYKLMYFVNCRVFSLSYSCAEQRLVKSRQQFYVNTYIAISETYNVHLHVITFVLILICFVNSVVNQFVMFWRKSAQNLIFNRSSTGPAPAAKSQVSLLFCPFYLFSLPHTV